MNRPLVSFTIVCYNQEKFIREALEGAFSQTYSPLEIIISDDCSKDSTFEIVQQMVAAYKGQHTVKVNRNTKNLGIAGNCNLVFSLCRGELIVGSAGDDISLPERTEIVVRAWNDSGCRATSLWSGVFDIDMAGKPMGMPMKEVHIKDQIKWVHKPGTLAGFLRRRRPHANGSTSVNSRKLLSLFGPLPETVTYEDTAYSFRTVLAGGHFTFVDAPLVKYRRHGQNLTFALDQVRPLNRSAFEDFVEKRIIEIDRFIKVYNCFAADAERALQHGLISAAEYPGVKRQILMECRRFVLKREILIQPWFRRLGIFFQLFCNTIRPREMLEYSSFLLPKMIYRGAVIQRNRIRERHRKQLLKSPS
jgi:glycosyltransferase involved in cell wall biosynthesis